ncbi:MAG: hypothetical protein KJZ78_26720 [Bryobacteraceae bacterium]|nr:hypothetical protein [Bryobacteraceae bacterium]HEU0141676.1 hypothetical protein [Bryobacteraceae bacterium]
MTSSLGRISFYADGRFVAEPKASREKPGQDILSKLESYSLDFRKMRFSAEASNRQTPSGR